MLRPLITVLCSAAFVSSLASAPDIFAQPWKMHHINKDYLIANSLQPGDVNGDGYDDYAVIDEFLGLQTIVFHPGPDGDVRQPWSRVVLGETGNPEYSCLGDLDGDGNYDLIVVEGDDLEKGFETGVRIWWGPSPDQAHRPEAWINATSRPGAPTLSMKMRCPVMVWS